MNKMIEYEKRLMQDREQIDHLLEAIRAGRWEMVSEEKLDELQREIDYMSRQIALLRQECAYHNQPQSAPQPASVPQSQSAGAFHPNTVSQPAPVPPQSAGAFHPNAVSQPAPVPPQSAGAIHPNAVSQPAPVPPQGAGAFHPNAVPPQSSQQPQANGAGYQKLPEQDVEKTIGKSVMAVCASILIFISFIIFATVVLPDLSNTVKMVLMYTVSLAFAAAGVLLLIKDKSNKWFLSIAGCGMGAVYISLMVSDIYFKAINEIVLLACIFIWAVFVCVLSRFRSVIFLAIGQAGIIVSVVFGLVLCGQTRDEKKLLILLIYFILTEAIYYISHFAREYNKNLLNHIFTALCLFLFLIGVNSGYTKGTLPGLMASLVVIAAAFILILLSFTAFQVNEKSSVSSGIFNLIYIFIIYFTFCGRFEKAGELIYNYVSLAPIVIFCLLYGISKRYTVYKVAGFLLGVLFLLIPMNFCLHFVWGTGILAALMFGLLRHREQYHTWIKTAAYLSLVYLLLADGLKLMQEIHIRPVELRELIILAILAIVNAVVMKLPELRKNLKTGLEEQAIPVTTGILNLLFMATVIFYILFMEPVGYQIAAIILGIALFTINSYSLVKQCDASWSSIYVGTKYLILAWVVLRSFSAPGLLVSVTGLIFAIIFISTGFWAQGRTGRSYQAFRIYGLVLALIHTVKLVVLDIHYKSMLLQAAGFFVSGILCFIISLIYHHVDKSVSQEQKK